MLNQVIELTKVSKVYFQNQHQRRLFFDTSLVTSCLLLTLCAVVTSQQYFGKPIECMQHIKKDKSIPETVLNKFCFISVTYTAVDFSDSKVISDSSKRQSFYPWIPLVLLLQGLSFLLPQNFWAYMDGGFFEKCLRDRNTLISDNKKLQPLGRYIAKRMSTFRVWSIGYIISELIYVLNVILNFILTDVFLGGSFVQYGFQVFYSNSTVGSTLFPSMTRCTFHKYGPSGTIENRDALCVMTLNMLNEKFYLLLWFWFSFLLTMSAICLIYRVFFLSVIMMKTKCSCIIRFMFAPKLGSNGIFILISRLTITDWVFIQQLRKSMYDASYTKLLENIVLEMSEPQNIILNGVRKPRAYQRKNRSSLHSNSNV